MLPADQRLQLLQRSRVARYDRLEFEQQLIVGDGLQQPLDRRRLARGLHEFEHLLQVRDAQRLFQCTHDIQPEALAQRAGSPEDPGVEAAHEHHRAGVGLRRKQPQLLHAVGVAELQVQHNDLRWIGLQALVEGLGIRHRRRIQARQSGDPDHKAADRGVIVEYQHAHDQTCSTAATRTPA